MTTPSNDDPPQGSRPLWLQIARVLSLAVLVISLFLLGHSMVRHRFFRGGSIDQNGHMRQR
jgi:hypothetical protein